MKIIEKVHLINWHYIEYKTVKLNKGVNFLTGENGAGKSTILDAVQLLIMGDTRGGYFNKAANEKSKRKLVDYLMGMNNIEENGVKSFVRSNDFSSYIAMQVYDNVHNNRFVLGIGFDVSGGTENIINKQWFYLNRELPEGGFLRDGTIQTLSEFKRIFIMKGDLLLGTDKEYRALFKTPKCMGNIKEDFYSIFKSAVAFKPPENIRDFLESFVCENKEINVEDMKSNIETYKRMENQILDIEEQILQLERIHVVYKQYQELSMKEKSYAFGVDKIDEINALKKMERLELKCEELRNSISELEIQKNKLLTELDAIKIKEENKRTAVVQAENQTREKKLKEEIDRFNVDIERIQNTEIRLSQKIGMFLRWREPLDEVQFSKYINSEMTFIISEFLHQMEERYIDYDQFTMVNGLFNNLKNDIDAHYYNISNQIITMNNLKQDKDNQLVEWKTGLKGYKPELISFKEILSKKLSERYNSQVDVEILADLIDIRDPEWSNAIEAYMNNTKLNIIIEPKYYEDALEIYKSLDASKYDGIGLVDIEKVKLSQINVKRNSLAEEIVTDNALARVFVDYLLQNVIKCNSISEIRNHSISITKDCFLYKGYIASRMNQWTYTKNRCIGEHAIRLNIEALEREICELSASIQDLKGNEDALKKYKTLKLFEEYEIREMKEIISDLDKLDEIILKRNECIEELKSIDLTFLMTLREELKTIIGKKEQIENEKSNNEVDLREKNRLLISIVEIEIPEQCTIIKTIQQNITDGYTKEFLECKYVNDLLQEINNNMHKLLIISNDFAEKQEKLISAKETAFNKLVNARKDILLKHQVDKGYMSKNNDEYDRYLDDLKNDKLTSYKERIHIQQEKAYEQFKEEFLCKLHDAIKDTIRQVNTLNKSLEKIPFGKDKYKFNVKGSVKHKKFYDMINDENLINSPLMIHMHSSEYKEVINELFDKIVEKGETIEERNRVQQNIEIFTNYKTYMDFDMTCTTEDGKKTSIAKAFNINSGGETQSPFYITILSAFSQMYQMDTKSKDDTMRLIMFDEAFNKMDDSRIASSINLINKMGFQALIVAPAGKIGVIGPLVDEVIHVEAINKEKIIVSEFTKKQEINDFVAACVI